MKIILQDFLNISNSSAQRSGPVNVYLGGVNLYQGPVPGVQGVKNTLPRVQRDGPQNTLPRVQREGPQEKRRWGWRAGNQSENGKARTR